MNILQHQAEHLIETLKERIYTDIYPDIPMTYCECDYKSNNMFPAPESMKPLDDAVVIGGRDKHFWLHFNVDVPKRDDKVYLIFGSYHNNGAKAHNPQSILYVNGEMVQGLDINHTEYLVESGASYDIYIYFYTGMLEHDEQFTLRARIAEMNSSVKDLFYDLSVPCQALKCFTPHDENYSIILKHLTAAVQLLDFTNDDVFYKSVKTADKYINDEFYDKVCRNDGTVVDCIGHTHIDVAWLWTYAQTKEKAQRSFTTVLSLMKQYPEYKFMSSQPQLYKYLKQEAPEAYKKLKEAVAEGRWEPEGAMWVEADCNLPSGESFVRQLMHGKRFFKEEFGIESSILWLPDVFGYSAALPQILLKSGVNKFVTSKISWNQYNQVPYDTFMWRGIDGSEVFAYFMTAQEYDVCKDPKTHTSYNGYINPSFVKGTPERYQQKLFNMHTMITYGYGDGGGGPCADMLEQQRRLSRGLPGIPATRMSTAKDFLDKAEKSFNESCRLLGETPRWVGELYLEMHRGTYTTAARNKKYNRKAEFLCQNTEAVSVFAHMTGKSEYPKKELYDLWERVLLNQFHDVIPGSSIREVYDDTEVIYGKLLGEAESIFNEKISALAENITTEEGLLVYNPLGFEADGIAELDGRKIYVDKIPAFGWKNITKAENMAGEIKVSGRTAENDYFTVTLDDDGNISSIFDKRFCREVVKKDGRVNQLILFEDCPYCYDAWEISEYYKYKPYKLNNITSIESFEDEVSAGFIIKRQYNKSVYEQTITIYRSIPRIDFNLKVDWHEEHIMLKTLFPFAVNTDKATYEIQFGNIERATHSNTSWDRAKFEVCGHKWADISDGGYGVSLINDCKYGYSADGSDLMLTLLRSSTHPGKGVDMGKHEINYALLPHSGSYRDAGTVHEAYKFNNPVKAIKTEKNIGSLPSCASMVSCNADNVIIETIKEAEDSSDIIIRMYEAHNCSCPVKVQFGFDVKEVFLCDLMENSLKPLQIENGGVMLNVSGFEIITLKVIKE